MDSGKPKYEDWLKISKDKTIQSADTTYAEATRQSDVARQRAIVDADTSYQKNVSDYGANAERLASMGLTNSGYADYQKSQSYAQMRGEVQYANAQKVASDKQAAHNRDQTKLGAEITYAQGMANKALSDEQTKNTTYLELLSGAGNGTYSEEQIRALGTQVGLSEEEIENVVGVYTTYEQNISNEKTAAKATSLKTVEALAATVTDEAGKSAVIAEAYKLGLVDEDLSDVILKMDTQIGTAKTEAENAAAAEKAANIATIEAYAAKVKDDDGFAQLQYMIDGYDNLTPEDVANAISVAEGNITKYKTETETNDALLDIGKDFDNGYITASDMLKEMTSKGYYDATTGTWANDDAERMYNAAKKTTVAAWSEKAYSGYLSNTDKNAIADAYSNGNGWLSKEEYEEIVSMHLDGIKVSDTMYLNSDGYMTSVQAKRELDKILSDPLTASTGLREEAQRIYNEQYSIVDNNRTVSADLKNSGKLKVTIATGWGDNQKEKEYVVGTEEVVANKDAKHLEDIAKGVGSKELFGYNGEIYFKADNGKIYKVEQWNNQKGDYHNVFGWMSGKW